MVKFGTAHARSPGPLRVVRAVLQLLTIVCLLASAPAFAVANDKPVELQFPQLSLGTIYVGFPGHVDVLPDSAEMIKLNSGSWPARGKVKLPAGHRYFIPSYYLLEHPQLLKTVDADAFGCISLNKMGIMQSLDLVIEPLSHMTGVRRLELQMADISDEKLKPMKALIHLEALDLRICGIHGSCIKEFLPLTNLKFLDLSDNRLEPETFAYLGKMRSLRTLNLVRTGVTDDGVGEIVKLPQLQKLYLANARISMRSLKAIAKLKTLRVLELTDTKFTASELLCLAPLKLDHLLLPRKFSPAEERFLRHAMPTTSFVSALPNLSKDANKLFAPLK